MKTWTQFLRERRQTLRVFMSFVKYEIKLGIGSIMRSIHMYLAMSKIYS